MPISLGPLKSAMQHSSSKYRSFRLRRIAFTRDTIQLNTVNQMSMYNPIKKQRLMVCCPLSKKGTDHRGNQIKKRDTKPELPGNFENKKKK
jgi:hypothetical protein